MNRENQKLPVLLFYTGKVVLVGDKPIDDRSLRCEKLHRVHLQRAAAFAFVADYA
jgi:TATA-box binding protein (TBP) (component of TFIID and TFIIIB)